MASLSNEHKVFIIKGFAAFQTPSQIVESVNEEFRLRVTRQQVWKYHPDNPQTADKWKELYKEFHALFVKETSQHAIFQKSYRGAELTDMYRKAKGARNFQLAAQLLEQGAKEEGGLYTNRRELTGKGGGPIETAAMTLDQWTEQAAKRTAQVEETMAMLDDDGEANPTPPT
jgi:hypothetical protein